MLVRFVVLGFDSVSMLFGCVYYEFPEFVTCGRVEFGLDLGFWWLVGLYFAELVVFVFCGGFGWWVLGFSIGGFGVLGWFIGFPELVVFVWGLYNIASVGWGWL